MYVKTKYSGPNLNGLNLGILPQRLMILQSLIRLSVQFYWNRRTAQLGRDLKRSSCPAFPRKGSLDEII